MGGRAVRSTDFWFLEDLLRIYPRFFLAAMLLFAISQRFDRIHGFIEELRLEFSNIFPARFER